MAADFRRGRVSRRNAVPFIGGLVLDVTEPSFGS